MSDILTDLYYGRISPWERLPVRNDEGQKTDRKIEAEKRYFTQQMSPDYCRRFQELENLYTQSGDTQQADAFCCGFKLGAEFMIEVLADRQ